MTFSRTRLSSIAPERVRSGLVDACENLHPHYPDVRYPDLNAQNLKRAISSMLESVHGLGTALPPERFLLTNGAVDALSLVLSALTYPGDFVHLLRPSFVAFKHFAGVHHLRCLESVLEGPELNRLPDQLHQTPAKIILLCSPNNPVGSNLALADIDHLCMHFDGLVVVDEAYAEFSEDRSVLDLITKFKNLIVLRTFSKAFALPAARCGFIVAAPIVIDQLQPYQIPFGISQHSLDSVHDQLTRLPQLQQSWRRVREEREVMVAALRNLNLPMQIISSNANFIALRTNLAHSLHEHLLTYKIQTLNPSTYPGFLRISLGSPAQNDLIVAALARFETDGDSEASPSGD